MEIKIFETEKALRIEKKCKKEQNFCRIILFIVYTYYIYSNINNEKWFIVFSLIFIYIVDRIITLKYMYEIIYINEENIYFNTGYNPKILNRKNYQRKYPLESLKFVYPWIFLEPRYITSKTERKNYLSRVHFDFDGEKKYDSWGACISMEEAGNVVERINSFLEKQKRKIN